MTTILRRATEAVAAHVGERARQRYIRCVDAAFPRVDPMRALRAGQHIRLRGCCCTTAHLEEGALGIADGLLREGRSLVWLKETDYAGYEHRLVARCADAGRLGDFRSVRLAVSGHGGTDMVSHTVPASDDGSDAVIRAYCPEILSEHPDVDLSGNAGEQVVMWSTPPCSDDKVSSGLVDYALSVIENAAAHRARTQRAPFVVILAFVTGQESSEKLARFLTAMSGHNVSVLVMERIHVDDYSTLETTEADALISLELGGGCWTRTDGDGSTSSVAVAKAGLLDSPFLTRWRNDRDRARWNSHAFLVSGRSEITHGTLLKGLADIRLPNVRSPGRETFPAMLRAVEQARTGMKRVSPRIAVLGSDAAPSDSAGHG